MRRSLQKNRPAIQTNIYIALLLYLLLAVFFYSLCRIGFYLFNVSFFPGMSVSNFLNIMYGGFEFDLTAILYSNVLFICLLIIPHPLQFNSTYKKIVQWVFVIVNSIAIAANVIDFIYYRFTLRRTTLTIFSQFQNETNVGSLFLHFLLTYWYAVLLFVIMTIALKKLYTLIDFRQTAKTKTRHYLLCIILLPILAGLFVAGARGGFAYSTRPITLSNATEFGAEPRDMNIVLNTPFALIRTANTLVTKRRDYFKTDDALNKVFTPLHIPHDTAAFKYDNVVIFILESFSAEFVSSYNKNRTDNYQGYAPFLDSLIGHSRAFQYSFANGRKSIEAMPSVLCSIPSVEVPFILSHYSGDTVNSLASLLKDKGYYSAFFHGAPNGSMGFLAFSKNIGYDDYFGKNEYNNDKDFDGLWGIWDEPFLQFFANKMNTFKQPFLTTVFTLSSHDPFKIPEKYKGVFKGGPQTEDKCIQYTDHSLQQFFATAQKMPWFKNTLFVFTADHASSQTHYPEYSSVPGYFSIPIFFYKPGENGSSFKQETIDQIDIMPTVLGYLHYDKPYIAFGRDVYNGNTTPYTLNYLNDTYNLFYGDYLLMYQNEKPIALYNYKTDFTQKHNLLTSLPDMASALTIKIKAFIQQYNNRIIDNNLTTQGNQMLLHAAK